MSPNVRLLFLLMTLVAMEARTAAYALPPVQTSGKISSSYRLNRPSEGVDTTSWVHTFELNANSYIWQPWFGIWRARGAISRNDISSSQDTTADIITGDVEVNLFHRSHFPFSAFVGVRDSRIDIDNLSEAASDRRTIRFGLTQQYRDRLNNAFYRATLQRDIDEDLTSGAESILDRFLVSADKSGAVHSYSGVVSVNRTTSTFADSETLSSQATVSHDYRPTPTLAIGNSANVSRITNESDFLDQSTEVVGMASRVEWRPEERWRLAGDVSYSREETEGDGLGAAEGFDERLRARTRARYELTDETTLFGELGLDRIDTESQSRTTTFQTLSATHAPDPIDWRGFSWGWNAGAGVSNQTDSEGDSVQSQTANLGHTIARTWIPTFAAGPVPVSFSASQEARLLNESDQGDETQISHRATLAATHSANRGTGFAQLAAFDIRTFGRTESAVTSLNASTNYNYALTRYRNINAYGAYNFTTSRIDDATRRTDGFSTEVRYRDARLFNVNRLAFETRLRLTLEGLLASNDEDREPELEWENRLRYTIGLLELDSRLGMTRVGDNQNILLMFTITRRF